jgi:hypothetical protein
LSQKNPNFIKILLLSLDDERLFGFLRVFTGDELSKRAKFAFVAWIGSSVSALKRAKCSIDKSLVKEIVSVSC